MFYTGTVSFKIPDSMTYQVEADDVEDAAFEITSLAKDDFPDAVDFSTEDIKEVV